MTPEGIERPPDPPGWLSPVRLSVRALNRAQTDEETTEAGRASEPNHPDAAAILEATLDACKQGILVVERDGRVIDYNERFLNQWGIPETLAEERDDEKLFDYVEGKVEDPEAFRSKVEEVSENPETVSQDRVRFEDGRVYERFSQPQRVDGEIVGRVWCFRDVTEEVEAKRDLEESNEQLENFASLVSHDLREPLRGIQTHLDILEREAGEELSEKAREALEFVQSSADRSQEMVKGLHRLSKLDQDGVAPEQASLEAVVEEALVQLKDPIDETNATIEFGSLPPVHGDRAQLVTLFQNLLGNAIVYRGDGPPKISIRTRPLVGGRLDVEVTDEGTGVPEDDQEAIFEMFRSGSNGHDGGSGIGLALCRRIVERHGGEIDVASTPGDGACFSFTLPAADGDPTNASAD